MHVKILFLLLLTFILITADASESESENISSIIPKSEYRSTSFYIELFNNPFYKSIFIILGSIFISIPDLLAKRAWFRILFQTIFLYITVIGIILIFMLKSVSKNSEINYGMLGIFTLSFMGFTYLFNGISILFSLMATLDQHSFLMNAIPIIIATGSLFACWSYTYYYDDTNNPKRITIFTVGIFCTGIVCFIIFTQNILILISVLCTALLFRLLIKYVKSSENSIQTLYFNKFVKSILTWISTNFNKEKYKKVETEDYCLDFDKSDANVHMRIKQGFVYDRENSLAIPIDCKRFQRYIANGYYVDLKTGLIKKND